MELIKDYYNSLSDYEKERFKKFNAKAAEYFKKKERAKFYHIKGYDSHSEGEIPADCWLSMTDENVKQLQDYLVSEYDKYDEECTCKTWEDFLNSDPDVVSDFFDELYSKSGLWNDLVVSRVERNEMIPFDIDFNDYITCYRVKYFCYDEDDDQMKGPYAFNIELTDEEYILLLTLQLFERRGLTFNRLNAIAPDIFKKLDSEAEAAFMNQRIPDQWKYETYAVVLSEIIDDAKEIEG